MNTYKKLLPLPFTNNLNYQSMKNVLICLFAAFAFTSCSQKDKKETPKNVENGDYVITKEGINELKIGMPQSDVEKLLNQKFDFKAMKDSVGYWNDTVKSKYKDLEVSLYFERQYIADDSSFMQLSGVETSSPLCKTAAGIAVGDEKSAIIPAYEDNPINMGPEWENTNDTTWVMSKTKYSISVKDDKWDKQLIFHLVNKKVTSIQAAIVMEE